MGCRQAAAAPGRGEPELHPDGSNGEADKPGFLPFAANLQEENPARGYIIVSANYQPDSPTGAAIPVTTTWPTVACLNQRLGQADVKWGYPQQPGAAAGRRHRLRPAPAGTDPRRPRGGGQCRGTRLVESSWRLRGRRPSAGIHRRHPVQPAHLYELARQAMHDELGDAFFDSLLQTRVLDTACPA